MNNDIRNAFETMTPTESQKARMLSGIKSRAAQITQPKSHSGTKWLRTAAIAAVLCCLFTVTVFSEEINNFFVGIFTGDAIVGEEVRTNVYYDTDGHVEMYVEEVLSDLSCVRAVVCYNALDEQGREWLSSLSMYGSDPAWYNEDWYYRLSMWTSEQSSDAGGAGGVYELEEYRTDTNRRFVLFMELSNDHWGTRAQLNYSMTGNIPKSTVIDVSTTIEKLVFDLDSPRETDRLYRPTLVKLSPLSITVCGENLGAFYYVESPDGSSAEIGLLREDVTVESMRLIFDDGSEIVMFDGGNACQNMSMFGVLTDTDDPCDCMIATMSFAQPIDPDTVSGIEIDGVYYPFG